jgi:hypothetical protein
MLPALFGLSPDFASSRVLALIFVFCDVYLLYRTVRLLARDSVARIAIVPVVTAFATFRDPNLLHYSSEQTPLLVISAALYTSVSVLANPSRHRMRLLFLGFLTSAGFFSKMQSVPVIVVMGAVAIAYTHASRHARRFWRPSALYAAGALPLLLLNAALCWAGSVWRDFWMSYIISNQSYADVQGDFLPYLPKFVQFLANTSEVRLFLLAFLALGSAFVVQRMRSDRDGQQDAFLQLCFVAAVVMTAGDRLQSPEASTLRGCLTLFAIVIVPLYFLFWYRPRSFGADPVRWFGLLSTLSIAAALYSVYKPHRPFPHYLLFLYIPVFAAMAWMLIRQVEIETLQRTKTVTDDLRGFSAVVPFGFVFLFVVLAVVDTVYWWGCQAGEDFAPAVATVKPPEGDFIRSITSPDGQITVWGHTADPYLGSGRVAATRDLNVLYLLFVPPDVASYYRARWLHDIAENPPELFIDAIGVTYLWTGDRATYTFEKFPEIAKFVDDFYVHLADGFGQRYYLRRDLAVNRRSISLPKSCAPEALRCVDAPLRGTGPWSEIRDVTATLPKVDMPAHALIEALFTPAAVQTADATVFNNEAVPYSHLGFRFHSIGDDRYQLVLGLGTEFAFSKPIPIPPGKQALISIEMNDRDVYIRANGTAVETMRLKARMADAPGPVTLASYIDGHCRFWGTIQFFQILDLDKKPG